MAQAFAMTMNFVSTLALTIAVLGGGAQQPENPALQHRPAGTPADQSVKVTLEGGKTVLPDDAFGLYRYADREGEFGEGLQVNQQFGEVSGYFSVSTGSKSHGKLLTYFLSEVEGGNPSGKGHFSFTTRQVHGIWYTFDGRVFRGKAANPIEDGYYLMNGTLTIHDDVQKTTQNTTVGLKLTAMH
jgi:hypothetical protein